MNIWWVNQFAVSPAQAGGTRHHSLARELAALGHRVTLVAGDRSYMSKTRLPAGEGDFAIAEEGGVTTVSLTVSASGEGPLDRARSMGGFARAVRWGRWRERLPRPDVIVGSSPSPMAAAAALMLARRLRVPFVLEVRDLWPDSIVDLGILSRRHPALPLLRALETFLYRRADLILSLLSAAAPFFESRGVRPDRIVHAPNGVDAAELLHPIRPEPAGPFTAMYAGAIRPANGLDVMVETAAILARDGDCGIRLRIVGDGSMKADLERQIRERNLGHVIALEGPFPKAEMRNVLPQAHAFVHHLLPAEVFRWGISPNKVFDYLAYGRPIVLCCSSAANPVVEADAGFWIPPSDPAALAGALRRLRDMPAEERAAIGRKGRLHVEARHSYRVIAATVSEALGRLGGAAPSRRPETASARA